MKRSLSSTHWNPSVSNGCGEPSDGPHAYTPSNAAPNGYPPFAKHHPGPAPCPLETRTCFPIPPPIPAAGALADREGGPTSPTVAPPGPAAVAKAAASNGLSGGGGPT